MNSVWRKLKRSNQDAYQFRFALIFQELQLDCSTKWQPKEFVIAWVRRRAGGRTRRRYESKVHKWEPTLTNPLRGVVVWPTIAPEVLEIVTTLYKDKRTGCFDDKEWSFVVEERLPGGGSRPLASVPLNLRLFVVDMPGTQTEVKLRLRPNYKHVSSCILQVVLSFVLEKTGSGVDDDLQSISSFVSMRNDTTEVKVPLSDEQSLADSSDNIVPAIESTLSDITWGINALTNNTKLPTPQRQQQLVMEERFEPSPTSLQVIDEMFRESQLERVPEKPTDLPLLTAYMYKSETVTESVLSEGTPLSVKSPASAPTYGDLLTWCQAITKDYPNVPQLTNFGECWRNGMAFAAIVYHFRPDLIDFEALDPKNIRDTCSKAFDAAERVGVPRLLEPSDMVFSRIPDKVNVMTYVYQLRTHLTGQTFNDQQTMSNKLEEFPLASSEVDSLVADEFEKLRRKRDEDTAIRLFAEFSDDSERRISTEKSAILAVMTTPITPATTPPDSGKHEKRTRSRPSSQTRVVFREYPSTESLNREPLQETPLAKATDKRDRAREGRRRLSRSSSERRSGEDSPRPFLMTRDELRNPFDSEADQDVLPSSYKSESVNVLTTPVKDVPANDAVTPEELRSFNAVVVTELQDMTLKIESSASQPSDISASEDVKARAKKILAQFRQDAELVAKNKAQMAQDSIASASASGDTVVEETPEERRKREVRLRAKKLIEEAKEQVQAGRTIKISETVPARMNGCTSPEGMRFLPSLQTQSEPPSRLVSPESSPAHALQPRQELEKLGLKLGPQFDRFKRFGSMRAQELTAISSQLAKTVRNYSTVISNEVNAANDAFAAGVASTRVAATPAVVSEKRQDTAQEPVKLVDQEESHGMDTILRELESVSQKMAELNLRAVGVERELRRVLQNPSHDPEDEERLTNEFLVLLNERNQLTRREYHLQLMQQVKEQESRTHECQRQLAELLNVPEYDKTEEVKQNIDKLMNELIHIVNLRDQLSQQLITNEQDMEEDVVAQVPQALSGAGPNSLDQNCVIQ